MKTDVSQIGQAFWRQWTFVNIASAIGIYTMYFYVDIHNASHLLLGAVASPVLRLLLNWLVLRRYFAWATKWILASAAGWILGTFVNAFILLLIIASGIISGLWPVLISAVFGFSTGLFQWWLLRKYVARASVWAFANTIIWATSELITSVVPDFPRTVYFAVLSGALSGFVIGAASGAILVWLFKQQRSSPHRKLNHVKAV
jgi:hypothetical protein